MNKEYMQINVNLINAKLEANSGMKRNQSFLTFSKDEASKKASELKSSAAFGSQSKITFTDANTGSLVSL